MNKMMVSLGLFNFEKGDVIKFCDEEYFVLENNGNSGLVCPVGETFYIRNFYWEYGIDYSTLSRKATNEELRKLGLA